ncbi:hypothetical protein [Lysinibacillus sp. Y5S-8]
MVNGNGGYTEKAINLMGSCSNSIKQDHLNIIEIVLKIDNKKALDSLYF